MLEDINNLNKNASNNLEEKYKQFIDITNKSARQSIPESVINKYNNKRGQIPWWDTSCNREIAKRKLALTKFNRTGSYHDYLNFKKTCAKTKKYLKNRQRLEWNNYCEKISPATTLQDVWKMIRRISGNPLVGRSYDDDWIPQFLNNYCGTKPIQNNVINCENNNIIVDEVLDSNITLAELKSALAHNKNTSTGMDRINYKMIQEFPENGLNYLVGIMNASFISSYIPSPWKNHVVIPILKKDKDPNDHSSYRPITLLSCVGKTLESIFKRRIEWFMEHFDKFPKSQFGFRKGKGVHDNLNILNTDIRISFSKNEYLLAVFIDVQGAYDNIDFCILIEAMKNIGLPNKMINWIISYFQERNIYVRYDNRYFGPQTAYKGIPQGSILGPILYSIYTTIIESYVTNDDIEVLQFADDIVIYTSSKCLVTAAEKIQNSLYKIEEVFNKLNMKPSTQKTQLISFTRHRINFPIQLLFFNDEINMVNSVKYLGVYFDKNMRWKNEILKIKTKSEKGLNLLRKISGVTWGAHPISLIMIYKAVIQCHFDFSASLIDTASKTMLESLDKIQFKALRLILGAMKSTPTHILNSESGEMPLHLRRINTTQKFLIRRKSVNNEMLFNKLIQLDFQISNSVYWANKCTPNIVKCFRDMSNYSVEQSYINNEFRENFNIYFTKMNIDTLTFKKELSDVDINKRMLEKYNPNYYDLVLYTDGSVKFESSSSTYAIYESCSNKSIKVKINRVTSSFFMEVLAIKEAFQFIHENRCFGKNVIIFTDSKSALEKLNLLSSRSNNSKAIVDIKRIQSELTIKSTYVKLVWVPGHRNIEGNIKADELANQAHFDGSLSYDALPAEENFKMVNENVYKLWNDFHILKSQNKGKCYFEIQPKPLKKIWFNERHTRKYITTISRLRSTHCKTAWHLAKIKILTNNTCECGEIQDIDHIMLSCEKNKNNITAFLKQVVKYSVTLPINIKFIIKCPKSDLTKLLFEHIKRCNIEL